MAAHRLGGKLDRLKASEFFASFFFFDFCFFLKEEEKTFQCFPRPRLFAWFRVPDV